MASTVMANWGGVQLLDTVTVSAGSKVHKPTNYFETLGVMNYDLILVETTQGDKRNATALTFPAYINTWEYGKCVATYGYGNNINVIWADQTPNYWDFQAYYQGSGTTFNIYGIKL